MSRHGRPGTPSTTPTPHRVRPGSMPSTRTAGPPCTCVRHPSTGSPGNCPRHAGTMETGGRRYIVPPMDDEPPRDFVDFVAVHLADAQREAAVLAGGPEHADEIYPAAFSDVASRWRRLRLYRRLRRRLAPGSADPALDTLNRRLAMRAKRWRDEQIYDVDVQVLRMAPVGYTPGTASVALRRAAVLP